MQLIVCSIPEKLADEHALIQVLFDCGMETFHLRKPSFTEEEMRDWLSILPATERSKIVLHSHWPLAEEFNIKGIHIGASALKNMPLQEQESWKAYAKRKQLTISSSVHNQEEINRLFKGFDYVWLSPVFESISKQAYNSSYSDTQFNEWIRELKEQHQTSVYALGGVKSQHAAELSQRRFDGMVVLGSVWSDIKGIKDKELVKQRINQLISSCKTDLIS